MSQPLAAQATPLAHAAFLATQQVHPILQQINDMKDNYGDTDAKIIGLVQSAQQQQQQQQQGDVGEEIGRLAHDGVNESISTEVFSSYRHREVLPGCLPHPGDIVEAGPLAAITPPDTYYPLEASLPKEIITDGKLSSLQLEGVINACQRHQMILPNGQRAGFFIGDAAGVGKGRQISGIILDNFARGRTKSIWFTISADLIVDARRDLGDLGCYIRVIDGCQELDKHTRVLGLPSDFKEGVVFSTYATLVSTVQKGGAFSSGGRQTRLQQLVNWCGGQEFDGCLIFDECHKAKNFVPGKEQASTKVAMAVTSIQKMLPKARVLYCSATGVTDVKNMAFMERLGLWGEGAPYTNFEQFLVSIQKKGLGMAEMLAMEMKSTGMYVSRGLSYKQAEFLTVEASLTDEQIKMYDTAVHVWNELRKALESAIVRTTTSTNRVWANFWSCHQRFFKQLCLGMKVPTIVKVANEALEAGQCIVIGLQTTGEASLDSQLGKGNGTMKGFMSLCREMLARFIELYFPTRVDAPKENEIKEDPWSVTAKKMLLDFAKRIPLPDSPLDEIIDKLGGPNMVSEMTGRKGRVVRYCSKDTPQYETRTPDTDAYGAIDSLNVQERNAFMEGRKLVAIISDAASTGISLHADKRVANQCRRVHLTVELPWSADKAVQQLGRSHRSNQTSGPLYKLLTTDLGGERRFAAAVARRLQSLGALTKGDRRAATGADLTEFNFDTSYGRQALRLMYNHICQKTLAQGISLQTLCQDKYDFDTFNKHMQEAANQRTVIHFGCLATDIRDLLQRKTKESLVLMGLVEVSMLKTGLVLKEADTGDVGRFLNRILGLSVEKQNMMFTYFTECMKLGVQNAKKEGRYNEGMLDITAASVEMVGKPKEIFKDLSKGHTSTRLVELNVDRGMSWEQAVTRADNYTGHHDGFYVSRRDVWGKKLYILATQKENSTHLFKIARPNTGLSYFDDEKTDLMTRYMPISRQKAEVEWNKQYEITKTSCVHGSHCKNSGFCKVGSRCYRLHLLCGSIVFMMNILETTLARNAGKLNLSKSESSIRVVRVQLNDGERVVGIRYPDVLIPEVERALKEQRLMETFQQQRLAGLAAVLQGTSASQYMPAVSSLTQNSALLQTYSQLAAIRNTSSSNPTADPLLSLLQTPSGSGNTVTTPGDITDSATPGPSEDCADTSATPAGDRVDEEAAVGTTAASSSTGSPAASGNSQSDTVQANTAETVSAPKLKAVIEEVAGVSAKCLSKALKPPVTIKNFFKPKVKEASETGGTSVQNSSSNEKENRKLTEKKGQMVKKEMSYEQFLKGESACNSATGDGASENGEHKTGDLSNNVTDSSPSDSKTKVGHAEQQNLFRSRMSNKRSLDSGTSSQPAKRAKQATLFSTMKKMASKKEEEKQKSATCPICSKVFEIGISNTDLNNHIDNCIIE